MKTTTPNSTVEVETHLRPPAFCGLIYSLRTPCRRRVISDTIGPSLTRQEFAEECDINRILARFQRTGALTHFSKYGPTYGDFSACDLQTAQNLLLRARQLFADLPSKVRDLVQTPEGFLDFVQNPANASKMADLGLTNRPATPVAPPPAPALPTGA